MKRYGTDIHLDGVSEHTDEIGNKLIIIEVVWWIFGSSLYYSLYFCMCLRFFRIKIEKNCSEYTCRPPSVPKTWEGWLEDQSTAQYSQNLSSPQKNLGFVPELTCWQTLSSLNVNSFLGGLPALCVKRLLLASVCQIWPESFEHYWWT